MFHSQGIVYKSAKKKKGMTVGFVNFESAEQVKRAMEVPCILHITVRVPQKLAKLQYLYHLRFLNLIVTGVGW